MRRAAFLLGLSLAMAPAWVGHAGDAVAPPDHVLAFAPVPDAVRKVGETRLVARADAVVVQTLLSTKLLARVIAGIRTKEQKNWPDGADGAEGRRAYLDALASTAAALERRPADAGASDRRQRLLIEFSADGRSATLVLGTFAEMPSPGEPGPASREILAKPEVPRAYVLRNMRLVLADSFHLDEKDVDRLGPLGPAAAAVPATDGPR